MNFILDADIRSFFTEVSQEWVVRFLEHRIGDTCILRLVQKWLRPGVLEDGIVTIEEKGTGQGSVISPLLAGQTLSNDLGALTFGVFVEAFERSS